MREAWEFAAYAKELIVGRGARRVCEIGAGANPALDLDFIARNNLDYVAVDVEPRELAKAPRGYRTIVADAGRQDFALQGQYDLVLTKMVAEHIRDPEVFHRNVLKTLADGGLAFHLFPTLYATPFVVNRLLPDALSEAILVRLQPGRERHGQHQKFPAYYRWCRGPTKRQIARFERLGYEVEAYVGFFGHGYYQRVKPLAAVANALTNLLLKHPVSHFTSFAHVVLRRPSAPREDRSEREVRYGV